MRVFEVYNSCSSFSFGFFAAVDAEGAINAMMIDAGAADHDEPSAHIVAELADEIVVLGRVEAAAIGFELDGSGEMPAATLYVRVQVVDGRASVAFCCSADADLWRGESWHVLDLDDAQLAADAVKTFSALNA